MKGRINLAIQLKRSLTSELNEEHVLLQGQIGIEMPYSANYTNSPFIMKIGDGTTPFKNLPCVGQGTRYEYDILFMGIPGTTKSDVSNTYAQYYHPQSHGFSSWRYNPRWFPKSMPYYGYVAYLVQFDTWTGAVRQYNYVDSSIGFNGNVYLWCISDNSYSGGVASLYNLAYLDYSSGVASDVPIGSTIHFVLFGMYKDEFDNMRTIQKNVDIYVKS